MAWTEERRKAAGERLAAARAAKAAERAANPQAPGDPPAMLQKPKAPNPKVRPAVRHDVAAISLTSGLIPTRDEMQQLGEIIATLSSAGCLRELTEFQAMAVMLKGWELDLKPIQSIEGLYIAKDGQITMRGDLMRALIQRSGLGLIIPVELTDEQAVVKATRYGHQGRPDDVTTFTYTVADATAAGLMNNDVWRKQTKGCLFGNATSAAARGFFSDILRGACYTPEELPSAEAKAEAKKPEARAPRLARVRAVPPAAVEPAGEADGVSVPDPVPGPFAVEGTGAEPLQPKVDALPAEVVIPREVTPPPTRELTHSFTVTDAKGMAQVVRTAGISRGVLKEIMDRTTARAGFTDWQAGQDYARGYLVDKGVTDLRMLTELEGLALIQDLASRYNAHASAVEAPGTAPQAGNGGEPTPSPHPDPQAVAEAMVTTFAEQRGVDVKVLSAFLCGTHDVASLEQLSAVTLSQALAEIRHLDRGELGIMLGRIVSQP